MEENVKKSKKPQHCPLACWDYNEDNVGRDELNLKTQRCHFPAWACEKGGVSDCLNHYWQTCPEIDPKRGINYLECGNFSRWYWLCKKKIGKKQFPLEQTMRHEVFKRDGYRCAECGATKDEITLHCDHILPVSQGGTDELSNLRTLCEKCNIQKGAKCF
jgi:hypothetical protein